MSLFDDLNDHVGKNNLIRQQRELIEGCNLMLTTVEGVYQPLKGFFDFVSTTAALSVKDKLNEIEKVLQVVPTDRRKKTGLNGTNRNEYLKRVQDAVIQILRQLIITEAQKNAVLTVKQEIQNWNIDCDPKNTVVPNIEKLLQNAMQDIVTEIPDEQVKEHELFSAFKSQFCFLEDESGANGDDDIFVEDTGMDIPTKCGITGMDLINPVKSNVCGHIFSKEGIEHIYSQSGGLKRKCPQGGCGKKLQRFNFEESSTLKSYVKLSRKRQERKRQLANNIAASQSQDIDMF